ncbi:hypothetical protein [Halovenus salina]|uniref:Uncharacterized protein n=1 Tax=Halovenus salina TaxID=1510225 RepID=A0ABD5W415_9EURY
MEVTDAKDSDGNNGGTNGEGSGLTAEYVFEKTQGLPNAPHISVADENYDPNTETTVSVLFNATGELAQSDINISILNSGSLVQDVTNFGSTEGSTKSRSLLAPSRETSRLPTNCETTVWGRRTPPTQQRCRAVVTSSPERSRTRATTRPSRTPKSPSSTPARDSSWLGQ